MIINVTRDNVVIDKNSIKPHENEYNITQCHFTFDDFIDTFQVKRAIFTILSTGEMYEVDIINNKCDIPSEVLKHAYETVKLGVYGYNIGENDELLNRFSPSYAEFVVPTGSYEEGALSPEPITPSQYDLYSQALQDGLQEVDDKLDEVVETVDGKIGEVDTKLGEVDSKLDEVDGKIQDVDTAISNTNDAIERTNNLNLDVSDKVDGDVTVTLTKKDASTKSVVISDGTSLQFMWQGTSLGIKTDDMEEYVFVDLQGIQGIKGDTGEPFTIKKTYSSVAEMNADFNNMEYSDYVMIASSVEVEDNAKLYTRGESQWIFITDFSGATGIRGPVGATPNIQIGSVTSGSTPSVTRTGTDENPILNFVLQPGPQGEVGPTGLTGNGIASITKTGTSGLVDTYTITFTNGNTTTFDVTNGKGIDRIEKTATVGNIDTYTIYFNDNSTSTFEVANGEVTKEELEEEVDRLSMIYNLFPTTSDEDTEMTLDGTGEVKLKKIGLKGNTSQVVIHEEQGTSVSNTSIYVSDVNTDKESSIEISGNTYQETTTGKNLFNKIDYQDIATTTNGNATNVTKTSNSISYKSNGNNNFSGVYISTANIENYVDNYDSDTTYCISADITVDKDCKFGSLQTATDYADIPVGTTRFSVYSKVLNTINFYVKNAVTNGVNVKIENIMVTTTNDSDYEPYTYGASPNPSYPQNIEVVTGTQNITIANGDNTQSTTYPINLGNIELCKIDTYQDRIYKRNDKWYLEKYIEKNTVNGTENWLKSSITLLDRFILNVAKPNMTFYKAYSNYFINTRDATTIKTFYMDASNTSSLNGRLVINFSNYGTTTLEQFKTWLSNNNVNTYYVPSATPTTTEITDSTLVSQLNALYNATIYPITNINTDTSNLLPYIDLHYNFITPSPSPSRPSVVNVVTGNNSITISNNDNTQSQTYPINLGNIELCKIGDYQDYIYKYSGKWCLNKQIGKVVLNGSESWSYTSETFLIGSITDYKLSVRNICLCSHFISQNNVSSTTEVLDKHITFRNEAQTRRLYIKDSDITSASAFKTWLSSNNVIVYYVLAPPTITEITDTTLIEQLDNLENAYSYDTQTNITQTNDDMPFILDVEALMSLKGVLN